MKNYRMRKKKWIISVLFCLIIAIAGTLLYIEFAPIFRGEFTPRAWDRHPRLRRWMISDMENSIDIRNLTKDEVIHILGTNDASFGISRANQNEYVNISYRIDFFRTHTRYIITFYENGEVRNAGTWGS